MAENKQYNYAGSLGRIQFLANLDIIKERLEKGHTFQSIYSDLVNEKKVTCSYKNFARYKISFLGKTNKSLSDKPKDDPQKNKIEEQQTKHTVKKDNKSFETENKSLDDFV